MTDIALPDGERVERKPRRRRVRVRARHAHKCPRPGWLWSAAGTGDELEDVGRCRGCGAVARKQPRNVTSGLNTGPTADHNSVFQRALQAVDDERPPR